MKGKADKCCDVIGAKINSGGQHISREEPKIITMHAVCFYSIIPDHSLVGLAEFAYQSNQRAAILRHPAKCAVHITLLKVSVRESRFRKFDAFFKYNLQRENLSKRNSNNVMKVEISC